MKKALAIMVILMVFVIYFAFMKYQKVGIVEVEGYVLSSQNVVKDLLQEDSEEKVISLVKVNEFDPIYRQGKNYYIGETKKTPINLTYPVYATDNSRIWNYSSKSQLITDQYEQTDGYSNLIIASTNLYNGVDYQKADQEKYWFVAFSEFLFMNNIPITVESKTETITIPIYSIISFQEERIRYYQKEEDTLKLKTMTGIDENSKVKINEEEQTYEELLLKLKLREKIEEEKPTPTPTKSQTPSPSPTKPNEIEDPDNNQTPVPTPTPSGNQKPANINVEFTSLEVNTYSIYGTLKIEDPSGKIKKMPTFEIQYKNQTFLRKTFSQSGTVEMNGLLPNSTFKLIGSYIYQDENGKQIKKTFIEETITTKDINSLEAIKISFKNEKVFAKKVVLEDFFLENESTSEVLKGIKKIVVTLGTHKYTMSTLQAIQLKQKEKIIYQTAESLKSNQSYQGKIEIYDVADNLLKVENGIFQTRTSKMAPTVELEVKETAIAKFKMAVNIKNPDNVYLSRLRYEIYDMNQKLFQEGLIEDQTITGKNLIGGDVYRVFIYADYDLEDGKGNQLNQLLRETKVSTVPLSTLGFARITFKEIAITQSSAQYEATINPKTTDHRLLELLGQVHIYVREKGKEEVTKKVVIKEDSIELLKTGNPVNVMIDSLNSKTEYEVEVVTIVKQGDMESELNALSNLNEFKTPKKDAKVEIINSFTTENLIDFDVRIIDLDKAIQSRRVLLEVRNSEGRLEMMKDLKIDADYERIQLEKLEKEESYTFKFIAEEYNIGYTNITFEGDKILKEIVMETTVGIYGSIDVESLLSQITSTNLINIADTSKWKQEGTSTTMSISNDINSKILKFVSKNGYANYSYYIPEYQREVVKVSFQIRHTKTSNKQATYLSIGGGENHQYPLSDLSTDWKDFTFLVTPTKGHIGFYIDEITNNNTTTEIEVRNLMITPITSKLKNPDRKASFFSNDYIFEKTVLKSGSEEMPTHDGTSTMVGNYGDGFAKITNLQNNTVTTFSYTGSTQSFMIPTDGKYKIEIWGASGGDGSEQAGFYSQASSHGGRGGYSAGEIELEAGITLYIQVGGKGVYGTVNLPDSASGGYNGGGNGKVGSLYTGAGGGGSTDIRLIGGSWNEFRSLKSRIMVAGGGGGADSWEYCTSNCSLGDDGSGGSGGGITSEGAYIRGVLMSEYGVGQFENDEMLGIGQSATDGGDSGGAGGGYYGGRVTNHGSGGGAGGSSYISGHQGCISQETLDAYKKEDTSYIEYEEKEKYIGNVYISLYDTKQEIPTDDFYVQILKNKEEEAIQKYNLNENHQLEKYLVKYEFSKNSSYELKLLVKIRNRYYTIQSMNFKTNEEIRTVRTVEDLMNIHSNGTYLVVNDLDLRNMGTYHAIAFGFSGTLDFQGHKLYMNTSNLFSLIRSSGKILNLDFHIWLNSASTWHPGLVDSNHGTLSNIIVTIEETVVEPSQQLSFLVFNNQGTIENFVVNLKQDLVVHSKAGLITLENKGTIQNGYLYGASIDARPDSGSFDVKRIGAVAGTQSSGGKIENVFSLIDIKVMEQQPSSGAFNRKVGNIIGYISEGTVSNVYSYTEGRNRDLQIDPNLGGINSATTKNLFYINPMIYTDIRSKKLSKMALRNIEFQEKIINGMNQFIIDDYVRYGYFPQLKMNAMMPKQEYIELPVVADEDLIDIISIENVESNGKEANVTLKIHNPGNEEITEISIKNLSTEIISQTTEDGTTILVVRVFNPVRYISSYFVKSISSIGQFNIPYTREYYENEKILEVDLYREIKTIEDWTEIKQYPGENYILMEDLDFSNSPNIGLNTINGVINGNGHTIRNIESSKGNGILIQTLEGGTLKNLYIENVKKTNKENSSGLIGYLTNSAVIDNVHITNISLPIAAYTGGISGDVTNGSSIKNSSVTGIKLVSLDTEQDVRIGGLAGRIDNSIISNCYVQELDLDTRNFQGSLYGMGGLVGSSTQGSIESSYAIGQIQTDSPTIGGIIGNNNGTIQNVYSMVDIKSSQGYIAGIVADDSSKRVSNTLSIGSIYSTIDEDTIRRTSGTSVLNQQNYAWRNQRINGSQSTETRGEILLTTEELQQSFTYESMIQLGTSFSYTEVENQILPKLYNESTKQLLPNQKDHHLPDHRFEVLNVETSKSITDAIILVQFENPENLPISTIEISDMEVTRVRRNITENGITSIEVQAKPVHYYDSYQLSKIIYQDKDQEKSYTHDIKIDLQFYKDLETFDDWQKIDPSLSENYRLIADIDFDGKENINNNISFNRLEGLGEGYTLKNIKITSNKAGNYLIREVKKNISKVNFENIEIKTTSSGIGTGIFGNTYGTFTDIKFINVKILSEWIQKIGIISSNRAKTIRNIYLENVEVKGNRHVGGFCGHSYAYDLTNVTLNHVKVSGKADGVGGMIGYKEQNKQTTHAKITADDVHVTTQGIQTGILYGMGSASEVTITNSSVEGTTYVGSVSGFQDGINVTEIKVDNVEVTGNGDYIGGLFGWHATVTNSSITNATIQAHGAGKYVGGIGGYGGYSIYDCLVQNVEILGAATYVGGLEGYSTDGPRQRNAVINTTINGNNYIGGLIGSKPVNQAHYVSYNIINAIVNASGVGAGGILGYYPNRLLSTGVGIFDFWNNIVANSTITASYYAGGAIGQVDTAIEGKHPNNIFLAVNVNTTNENIAPGLVVGNSDVSAEKIDNLKIYNQSQLNGKLAISEEILGVTVNNYVSSSELTRELFERMGYGNYMDLTPVDNGFYPVIKGIENQESIPLPVSTFRMARKSAFYMKNYDISFPNVNVYSSGIDKINIEFSEQNENLVMTLNGKNYPLTQRVMTFYYDYKQDISFTISDGLNTKEYKISKESLRKTLQTIGNYYYYLDNGEIKTNQSEISGTYIHLFDYYALMENGQIYNLQTKEMQENLIDNLSKATKAQPLYSGKYDTMNIETYYRFSIINGNKLIEKQLFVKNGKLTMMSTPFDNKKDSIVIDSYNNKDYLVLLGTDGVLYSLKSPIHYPSDFKNKKIKEMSSNILDQSTMIMIRYEDDSVYCFDYRIGTKIISTNKKEDTNIVNYIKDYISASYEETFTPKYMDQYKKAQSLIEELKENPIEKVLKKKEEQTEKEYIESYDALKKTYEVYEINSYLKNDVLEVTEKENVSINDTINSNYQLMSFYKNSNLSTPTSKELNGVYIFIGLIITLVSLFLILGIVFYKMKAKEEK